MYLAVKLGVIAPAAVAAFRSSTPAFSIVNPYKISSKRQQSSLTRLRSSGGSDWSVADDWSRLSSESAPVDTSDIYNADLAGEAARALERDNIVEGGEPKDLSDDDVFIRDTVDEILLYTDPDDPPLYDTASSFEAYAKSDNFFDKAGKEIGLLVRCNESPDDLLVAEGRALRNMEDAERYDVKQMVRTVHKDGAESHHITQFFEMAVAQIFHEHATLVVESKEGTEGEDDNGESEEVAVLDPAGVACWMTKSLGDGDFVGQHSKRVTAVISRYGTYGSGHLTASEFQKLYVDAVVMALKEKEPAEVRAKASWKKELKVVQPTVETIWRDLTNHGIRSPAEEERLGLEAEIEAKYGNNSPAGGTSAATDTLMDECEILEWGEDDHSHPRSYFDIDADEGDGGVTRKSSHEFVQLASDNKTPKRIRDGSFVFIDEESCIGCAQCATIAPSTFVMLESGRARTFSQSSAPEVKAAVSACPVSCMHKVAFPELKEFETARDKGDGRTDHRHFGLSRGHTPLNVAGIDSDANHKSSWYHYLKQKCYVSKSCPQKGCYDCPYYDTPGGNPYFKKRHREAEHARAMDLMSSGEADMYRKTAEL